MAFIKRLHEGFMRLFQIMLPCTHTPASTLNFCMVASSSKLAWILYLTCPTLLWPICFFLLSRCLFFFIKKRFLKHMWDILKHFILFILVFWLRLGIFPFLYVFNFFEFYEDPYCAAIYKSLYL